MTQKAKFTSIFVPFSLIYATILVVLHETGNRNLENLAHDLENLFIFLVCPIFYAAYFFERKTYITAVIYSTCLVITIHFFQKHVNRELWFVLIPTMTMATILAEFLFRSAQVKEKAVKEKFEAEKKASEIASKQKSQLLANVSHEIRNPLNGLCGMVRLLKDTPLNEEQSDYVSVMDESSKALMALVSDLLDVSKMEAGKLVLEQESFNIKSLIQDCSKMIQADLRRKNLSFEATYNTVDLLQVVGDKNRVRQVLLNLMSNAVKFTDEGSIRIHTDATKTSDNQVDLEIAVADTGIGIASSNQRSIFDVYSQAHSKIDSSKYGGTGLGLAISKKLVQHMGGRIALESRLSMGSTFKVQLSLPFDPGPSKPTSSRSQP